MDFGEVLRQAWKIIWKHKILWIFGIFAGCARGGGGGGGGNAGSRYNLPGNGPSGQNPFPQADQYFTQFGDWIGNHIWVVVLLVVAILVLIVLSVLLGTIGRIGLMKGTFKADGGAEHLVFSELWHESLPFFWRIFLLSLLLGVAFLIILLPLIGLGVVTAGVGFLCLIPVICILIPVSIVAALVLQQAELAIVLEDLSIMDGVRRGWEVFKKNLGPVLIIWIILAVIGFVVGIVIAIPVLIVVLPAVLVFVGNGGRAGADFTPLIIAGACLVAYLPVLLVLNGVLTAYLESVWTLTFMRLTKPKEKIESPIIPAPNA
jgi:hypothetical protein